MVNKLKKTWYGFTWSEKNVASDNLDVAGSDLLSIDDTTGLVVKSGAGDEIIGVSPGSKVYGVGEEMVFIRKNENLRVDLSADATLTQAMVGDSFDINANQEVVTAVPWTQVVLVEIVEDTVGRFKLV